MASPFGRLETVGVSPFGRLAVSPFGRLGTSVASPSGRPETQTGEEASGGWEACGQDLHRKTPHESTGTAPLPAVKRRWGASRLPICCEIRRRPTLPGRLHPSTIGAGGLNFRVRNGNGCDPTAIATETFMFLSKRQCFKNSTASTNIRFKIRLLM